MEELRLRNHLHPSSLVVYMVYRHTMVLRLDMAFLLGSPGRVDQSRHQDAQELLEDIPEKE